jgi:hypothetical protein
MAATLFFLLILLKPGSWADIKHKVRVSVSRDSNVDGEIVVPSSLTAP